MNGELRATAWIIVFCLHFLAAHPQFSNQGEIFRDLHLNCVFAVSGSTSTTSSYSSTDLTSTTGLATSTTDPTTTAYEEGQTESSNNALWLIIGVVCAVVLVLGIVIGASIVYTIHRSKRIHPHSDTESIYTSDSPSDSRPTTASHIHFEPEEEAMSKPVTMTPFELRKLYVETFPYRNWRRGYDGSLRPNMALRFVDPRIYAQTKGEERHFRETIYNYEMSDSLTLRSSALSRMMQHTTMPTMSEMEPVAERPLPPIGHALHERDEPGHPLPKDNMQNICMKSDGVELI